jgi:large subunit ribosomal protein L1
MSQPSRRYATVAQNVESDRLYQPREAIELSRNGSTVKFDETVEIHIRTGSDPRHADQMVRGVTVLPHGLGKSVRVLVFGGGEVAEIARQAGADYVGDDDLIQKVDGGWVDFDVCLAVPDIMPKIGKLGRILGRRGLMPNPRTGTMVQPQDLPRLIQEAKAGRLEFRADRTAIIHSPLGKTSFEIDQLLENLAVLMDSIMRAKPSAIKGAFLRTAYLTTTMGPSIPLDLSTLQALKPSI